MTLDDFKAAYSNANKVKELCDFLNVADAKVHLKGMAGSSTELIASGVFANRPGNYLYILPDKEEAAFFYNNLENLHKGEKIWGSGLAYWHG